MPTDTPIPAPTATDTATPTDTPIPAPTATDTPAPVMALKALPQTSHVYSDTFFVAEGPHYLFLPIIAAKRDYYVSLSGSDAGDCSGGTASRPWRTWSKAERCVEPGATVYFAAGTYPTLFAPSFPQRITFKGLPGLPITIRPAPGAQGQVFFERLIEIYGQHGVVFGIDIDANSIYSAVSIYQAGDILLQDNTIHGSRVHDCVHVHRDSDAISIIGNEIYDCGTENASYFGPGDGLDTTGATNVLYRGNHIHDAMAGIQLKGGTRDAVVESNRIHDVGQAIFGASMGSGLDPRPEHGNSGMHDPAVPIEERYQAKNVVIRNNVIYNTHNFAAIAAKGWVDYHIYHNSLYNHVGKYVFYVSGAHWEFFDSTAAAYCETQECGECTGYSGSQPCYQVLLLSKNGGFKNNILHTFSENVWAAAGRNAVGLELAGNIYYQPGVDDSTGGKFWMGSAAYSLRGLQSLGHEQGSHTLDPMFRMTADVAQLDVRLLPGSPAIDSGVALSMVSEDFDGIARPQGNGYDRGAFELVPDGAIQADRQSTGGGNQKSAGVPKTPAP
jgi:hypothetical protein